MTVKYQRKNEQKMFLMRVKPEVKEKLRRIAGVAGTSMTDLVREQMRHFFIENNLPTPR